MKVIVTGATGFIGRALCRHLAGDYDLVAITRDVDKARDILGDIAELAGWDQLQDYLDNGGDGPAIVNLAGENIAGLWTRAKKHRIETSRIESCQRILQAVRAAKERPSVMIQASAIGYYGWQGSGQLDEYSPAGDGFLARVCQEVEGFAGLFEQMNVRWVAARTGIVLGPGGGILESISRAYSWHLGGYAGSPRRWISWIHLKDHLRAMRFLLESKQLTGPFNLTGPQPVTIEHFDKSLGLYTGDGGWVLPESLVKILPGDMGKELFLSSQRVLPKRLVEAGFEFEYADVKSALRDIFEQR